MGSSDLDVSLKPSVKKASPLLEILLKVDESDGFIDCGVPEKPWDGSLQHRASKKGSVMKTRKCIRKQEKPLLLVVGEDVPLNEIMLTNALTLVGRFGGRKINAKGIHRWVADSWL